MSHLGLPRIIRLRLGRGIDGNRHEGGWRGNVIYALVGSLDVFGGVRAEEDFALAADSRLKAQILVVAADDARAFALEHDCVGTGRFGLPAPEPGVGVCLAAGRRLQVAWFHIKVPSRCHMYGTSRRDAVRRELNHVEVRQDERVRQAERIRPGEGQPRVARGIDHVGVRNLLHCHRLAQAEDAVGIRERDVLDVGYRIVGILFAVGSPDLEGGHARRRHMQRHGVFRSHAVRNANDRRVEVLV